MGHLPPPPVWLGLKPNYFGPKIFWTTNFFLDNKYFCTQHFFGSTIILYPKFDWTQSFSCPKFFFDPSFFWTLIFGAPNYLGHTIFLGLWNCWSHNIFGPEIFSDLKFFSNQKFLESSFTKFRLVNQSKQGFNQGQKRLSLPWAWYSSAPACLYSWGKIWQYYNCQTPG